MGVNVDKWNVESSGKSCEDLGILGIDFHCVRLNDKNSKEPKRLEEEPVKDMSSLDLRKVERVRRDQIRDSINALDAARQNEAREAESKRRQIWDQHHGEHTGKADLAGTERENPQVNDQDSPSSQPRWWKRIFIWKRVKVGLKGQSGFEGNRTPRTTGGT